MAGRVVLIFSADQTAAAPAMASADAVQQRLLALTGQCVRCGLCQPYCPTYGIDRVETESPRGRITLAAALAGGQLDQPWDDARQAIDHCLGCRRCESVCPAKVRFDELLCDSRALLRRNLPAQRKQRLLEWAIERRWPLRLLWPLARALRTWAPARWRQWVPAVPPREPAGGLWPTALNSRGRVALFTGCVARRLDADVHRSAIAVLNALGWDVWLPDSVLCCGALHRHAGALESAQREASTSRVMMDDRLRDCSAVLVASSGCHADLSAALEDCSLPVIELMSFVADDEQAACLHWRTGAGPVSLHTPCTQSSSVGRSDAAGKALSRLPGIVLQTLPDSGCCGAAGSHVLHYPQRAAQLRDGIMSSVATDAARLCTSNVGCRLHLSAAARDLPVQHPIELLAEHLP